MSDLVQVTQQEPVAKTWSQTKKMFSSQRTGENKRVPYPSDVLYCANVELFLDVNELSTLIIEAVAQRNNSEL